MPTPREQKIERFSEVTRVAGDYHKGGTTSLMRCEECYALVQCSDIRDDREQHRAWHEKLRRSLGYAY